MIFEDDPYVALRFSGETLPTMLSLDRDDSVVYASSFSKTVCPGIRVGYLVGPAEADRGDRQARDEHLHLAEHGRPVDRPRVLRVRLARALDRDGEDRARRAGRGADRGAEQAPPRGARSPRRRAATSCGSTLPEGSDVDAIFSAAQRARRGDRQGHGLPARGRPATRCASPTPASRPTRSTRACGASPTPSTLSRAFRPNGRSGRAPARAAQAARPAAAGPGRRGPTPSPPRCA